MYDYNTNLTIFVGNSSKIKKGDITNSITELLKLNCRKIILCAFPYFKNLSLSQNKYIHMLNKHVQFLASHYSDKFIYVDINSFVDELKSTRDTVYLPYRFRHIIARLLALYIHSDIISMSKFSTIINTADISNDTNVQVTSDNCSISAIHLYNSFTKEDPCVDCRISLPGDGMGVLELTPDHLN